MLGVRFTEVLTGTYSVDNAEQNRRARLSLATQVGRAPSPITGQISLDGLAETTRVRGEARFDWRTRRLILDVGFTGDDGQVYHLIGQRTLRPKVPFLGGFTPDLLDSSGQRLGEACLYLDPRADLISHVLSLRPVLGRS